MSTILQIVNADRNLSLFSRGIKMTGMESALNEAGPFTILGPVNLALGNLKSLSYDELLDPLHHAVLRTLLAGYVLVGKKMLDDLRDEQKFVTLDGSQVTVKIRNGETSINGAKILAHNRQGSNGVVHLLDKTYAVAVVG